MLLPNMLLLAALLGEPNILEPKPEAGGVLDLGSRADNILRCWAIALDAQRERLLKSKGETMLTTRRVIAVVVVVCAESTKSCRLIVGV